MWILLLNNSKAQFSLFIIKDPNQRSLNSFISLWDKTDINVHCLCGILKSSRASSTDSSEVNIHNMLQTIDLMNLHLR